MHFSSWTLRSRLIGLTVLLVAVTSVLIGGVMALVIRNSFTAGFDTELGARAEALGRVAAYSSDFGRRFPAEKGEVVAVYFDGLGLAQGAVVSSSNEVDEFSSAQLRTLRENLDPAPSERIHEPRTAVVDGRQYRFAIADAGGPAGVTVMIGRPTSVVNGQIAGILGLIAGVVVMAILLAGLLGAAIVGRALRPLRRVAAVASKVASLPLARGDVELPQRVPSEDTDPNTEVGQVGAALNNLLDSVETALAVRQASEEKVRHFVADASHELRTPLASIRGYAELTRRFGGELTDDVQHNIGRIESEAQRMTSLVEDLLLLARLDAERELDTSDVDLSRLLVDVVSDAHAAGPDHEWDLDLPDEPVIVRGDDARLQQVFTNLLANARTHTPAGTRVVAELSAPRDGHVLIRVRDDGPGIPEQLRPKLFGRFVRGDSSRARSTGSTGLGLAIVSAVVTAHHGTVSVASEPGTTVFTVQLPVEQPVAAPPARTPQPA